MRDHRRSRRLIAIVAIASALSACKNVPMLPGISPYRIDIQQGNVVTQDMIDKLKPGMTKQQVRFVMGSPPIVDPFHKDRWDYVYYLNKGGRVIEHRRLVLRFDGEVLKRVEGDVVVGSGDKGVKPAAGVAREAAKPSDTPKSGEIARPSDTARPSETAQPSETVKPRDAAKPGEIAKPSEAAKPSDAAKPSGILKPSEAVWPSDAPKPDEIAKPSDAAKPSATAKPGETANPRETTAADAQPQSDKQATP